MKNKWGKQDKLIREQELGWVVPKEDLSDVDCVTIKSFEDFDKIPKEGGVYFIHTTEPIHHAMHKHKIPKIFNNGKIIYNGIAKDDVSSRIKRHLGNDVSEGMSAISIDILCETSPKSHTKLAMSKNKKHSPFIENKRIKSIEDLNKMNLSEKERNWISNNLKDEYFLFNGINVIDNDKHNKYEWTVYFITGIKSKSYIDFIEHKWRELHGMPQLCSYSSGR